MEPPLSSPATAAHVHGGEASVHMRMLAEEERTLMRRGYFRGLAAFAAAVAAGFAGTSWLLGWVPDWAQAGAVRRLAARRLAASGGDNVRMPAWFSWFLRGWGDYSRRVLKALRIWRYRRVLFRKDEPWLVRAVENGAVRWRKLVGELSVSCMREEPAPVLCQKMMTP